MKKTYACLLITTVLCSLTGIAALDDEEPTPVNGEVEDFRVKVETGLMEVRTVVTDRDGRIVEGLTIEDFELLEDDKPREISHFRVSKVESERNRITPVGTAAAEDREARLQQVRAQLSAPPVRTILLYVDALHLSFESLNWVKQALNRFIDEQMTDQDLVAFTSSETLGVAQQFTRDKRILRHAVERMKLGFLRTESYFSPNLAVQVLAERMDATRVAIDIVRQEENISCPCRTLRNMTYDRASRVLTEASYSRENMLLIIEHFAEQMAELPGKRMMVVFSDGFTSYNRLGVIQNDGLQKAITTAVRNGMAIYTIDANGLKPPATIDAERRGISVDPNYDLLIGCVEDCERAYQECRESQPDQSDICGQQMEECVLDCVSRYPSGLMCEDDLLNPNPACSPPDPGMLESYVDSSETEKLDALNAIAVGTGGKLFENSNDLNGAISQALDDNRYFYILSYYLDSDNNPDRFRSIKVRIRNHPEYSVRTPRGYRLSKKTETSGQIAARTPQQRLIEAMGSPLPLTDLGVSARADFIETESDDRQVSLTVYFEGDRFDYREQEQGAGIELEILSVIYDSSGTQVDGISAHVEGSLSREDMEQVRSSGYQFSRRLPLGPGSYQARIGVREEGTNRMGTATTWVEVPKLNPDTLEMSSLILSNPLEDALIDEEGIDVCKLEQVKIVQGVPMYARDDIFYYSFRVHRDKRNSNGKGIFLMRELLQGGEPVRTEKWIPISIGPEDADSKGWFDQDGELDIEALDPGVYELRISVKEDGSDKVVQRVVAFGIL